MKAEKKIRKKILDEYKKGNIVIYDFEGLKTIPLNEIIKQPTDGLLYDLNRNESVILTFLDDPKWINDYACMQVIKVLKDKREQYAKEKAVEFKLHDMEPDERNDPDIKEFYEEVYDEFINRATVTKIK